MNLNVLSLALYCASCGAGPGQPCTSKDRGEPVAHIHVARKREAAGVLTLARELVEAELLEKGWKPPKSCL